MSGELNPDISETGIGIRKKNAIYPSYPSTVGYMRSIAFGCEQLDPKKIGESMYGMDV